jgi:NAD(P)-dependent dehydrogenase (short-subunit alcohol dehydrogenase family)
MTKAGIHNMSKALARECGQFGIRVNTLVPGLTRTKFAMALHDDEEFMAKQMPHTPLARGADPSEMAGAVLYLVSDAASYTTGSSIVIDGGYLA